MGNYTVCPGSSDPFHIVRYYIKWATTSWTHSTSWTDGTMVLIICYFLLRALTQTVFTMTTAMYQHLKILYCMIVRKFVTNLCITSMEFTLRIRRNITGLMQRYEYIFLQQNLGLK